MKTPEGLSSQALRDWDTLEVEIPQRSGYPRGRATPEVGLPQRSGFPPDTADLEGIMFKSPTYGKIELNRIPDKILKFYRDHLKYESTTQIIIGTDSQNFDKTKIVSVIAVISEGHGGIFFYEITQQPLIRDVRTKLHVETNDSLRVAGALVEIFENSKEYEEMYLNCPIAIHIDAGNSTKGKTKELIPELVGWIKACGYDCSVKPDSFVASTIADRLSK